MKKRHRIKDIPISDRPREKLLENGAECLSDKELIAILLRTGTREKSALDLADEILTKFGGLEGICGRDFEDFKKISGIKGAKLATIVAALEISNRMIKMVLKKYNLL